MVQERAQTIGLCGSESIVNNRKSGMEFGEESIISSIVWMKKYVRKSSSSDVESIRPVIPSWRYESSLRVKGLAYGLVPGEKAPF